MGMINAKEYGFQITDKPQKRGKLKPMERLLLKEWDKLQKEMQMQTNISLTSVVVVLWRVYGMRKTAIERRLVEVQHVWDECTEYGMELSMLGMCEDETGIELQLPEDGRSYHDIAYLDKKAAQGKKMTLQAEIRMRQKQAQWMSTILLSAWLIVLHRYDKWGYERLSKFVGEVHELWAQFGNKVESYMEIIANETNIDPVNLIAER